MQVDKARLSFITLVAALLAGIYLGNLLPWLYVPGALFFSFIILSLLAGYRRQSPLLFFIHLCILSAGWLSASYQATGNKPQHYTKQPYHHAMEHNWQVAISSTPRYRDDLISFEASVLAMDSTPVEGTVKLYLNAPYNKPQLSYGDVLSFYSKPTDIKPPANPYEFDYKAYLARQGITHQFYLYPGQWKVMGSKQTGLLSAANYIRSVAAEKLYAANADSVLSSIAISMILGDRSALDADTRSDFALTGAAHVLAISGLHVGLIFGILLWLWQWAIGKNRYKWIRFLLILLVLWLYALLTGLSPSVLRATVMFSFILAGMSLKEKGYVLNSLAASAFVLLLVNPGIIFNAGFWLSYSAVVGIVLLYPKIYALVSIKPGLRHFLWQLLVVSFCAQVATLPITIFLFHQTPVMGLLTNLIVVPLASTVLYSGLLYLLLSWVPIVSMAIVFILKSVLIATLGFVNWMAAWPVVALTGLYISWPEFILWLGLIISLTIWVYNLKFKPLFVAFTCILLLLGFSLNRQWQQVSQQQITVYSVYNKTVVDIFNGTTAFSINNLNNHTDSYTLTQKIQPNRDAHGIKTCYNMSGLAAWPVKSWKTNSGSYYLVGNTRIAIIDQMNKKNIPAKPLHVDYLIVSNNPKTTMWFLNQVYKARHIIIDRSNNSKKVEQWIMECKGNNLDCWNAYEEAFVSAQYAN